MKQHHIYVIGREEGPVKVGITSSLDTRLAAIQTGCHFKIELLYFRLCRDRDHAALHEKNFHSVYAKERLAGEWFDLTADLAIEGVETGIDMEYYFEKEAREEWMAAQLNVWQWGEYGAHPNH